LEFAYKPHNPSEKFILDLDKTENPHLLLAGGSGAGKTYNLKKVIKDLANKYKVIIVIDYHGDMGIEGENLLEYSFHKDTFGINPFELELNPKRGGVLIQAEYILNMLVTYFFDKGRTSQKQKNILERLIVDTYALKGIYQDDVESWKKEPPTMKDLRFLFNEIIKCYNNEFKSFKRQIENLIYDSKQGEIKEFKLTDDLKKIFSKFKEKLKEKNIDIDQEKDASLENISLDFYLNETVFKSVENLYSYIEKITKLHIFNGKTPKLKRGINRFDLSAFTANNQPLTAKFISEFIMQKFFRATMIRGEYSKYDKKIPNTKFDRVMVVDESKLALPHGAEKENPYNVINRIVTESRKYGLALILASQRLSHYSEEILSNIYTKMILGANSNEYKIVSKVLGVKESYIKDTFEKKNRMVIISQGNKVDRWERY